MLSCIPAVSRESCFALKGGTAINFFYKDMPRLSVDIDLTYCRLNDRKTCLAEIDNALRNIAAELEKQIDITAVTPKMSQGAVVRLVVKTDDTQIKIEPNTVLRGFVLPPLEMELSASAKTYFEIFTSIKCLSYADLYAGKLCATLDRQHPRDIFDIKLLIDDTGITPEIRKAFVVYLASHNRPMNELLAPRMQDVSETFYNEFQGMTQTDVTLEELQTIQSTLATDLVRSLNDNERNFLLSIKRGEPKWYLMNVDNIERFPAIQWKILNIQKMPQSKRQEAFAKLENILS